MLRSIPSLSLFELYNLSMKLIWDLCLFSIFTHIPDPCAVGGPGGPAGPGGPREPGRPTPGGPGWPGEPTGPGGPTMDSPLGPCRIIQTQLQNRLWTFLLWRKRLNSPQVRTSQAVLGAQLVRCHLSPPSDLGIPAHLDHPDKKVGSSQNKHNTV